MIATGGMAELYRAKIIGVQGFEKLIAVKRILPHLTSEEELITAFIDEAKLAALLNHQSIIQIYDFGNKEESYFIAMEYLFGRDLRLISKKSKEKDLKLSLEYCLYIISRICSGLDYAHNLKDFQGKSLNLVHRDISPQNIIVTYEGDVKIVDFGIAKAATQSTKTQVGMIKGKVAYMSPEQAEGKQIDHRSDIFATGILLYELVTGKRMFEGDTLHILSKVRKAEFTPAEDIINDLPFKLYDILNHALAKNPTDRYQSCGEMLADLEECIYERSLKPTSTGLSQYMKALFANEIDAEQKLMREATKEYNIQGEKSAATASPPEKDASEKIISITDDEDVDKPKKPIPVYAAIAGAVLAIILIFVFWPKDKPIPPTEELQSETVTAQAPLEPVNGKETDTIKETAVEPSKPVETETISKSDTMVESGMSEEPGSPVKPAETAEPEIAIQDESAIPKDVEDIAELDTAPPVETQPAAEDMTAALTQEPAPTDQKEHPIAETDNAEDPQVAEALEALENKDLTRAITIFQEIYTTRPEMMERITEPYSQALEEQASTIMDSEPANAEAMLLKAVVINPVSISGHSQLGRLYVKLKDYPKAIESYEIAVSLDPEFPDTFFNLGYVYAVTKDYPKSEEMYGRVAELNPDYIDEVLFNLAVVQDKQGKTQKAIENLERSLAINPDNKMAIKYIQKLKEKSGEG
jgi:serine/threonine protein kinase